MSKINEVILGYENLLKFGRTISKEKNVLDEESELKENYKVENEEIKMPEFPENVIARPEEPEPRRMFPEGSEIYIDKVMLWGVSIFAVFSSILVAYYFLVPDFVNSGELIAGSSIFAFIFSLIGWTVKLHFDDFENKVNEKRNKVDFLEKYVLSKKELEKHYTLLTKCLGKEVLEREIKSTLKLKNEGSGSFRFVERLYLNCIEYLKNEEDNKKTNGEFIKQVDLIVNKSNTKSELQKKSEKILL